MPTNIGYPLLQRAARFEASYTAAPKINVPRSSRPTERTILPLSALTEPADEVAGDPPRGVQWRNAN
ncbi:hypothetical protein [Nocardia sp. NPDC004123]